MASSRTFAESDAKEDAMAAANKKLRHTTIVNTQYRTYHSCQQPKEWAYCQPPSLAEVKDLVKIMEAKGYEPARERLQNACEPIPLYYPANRSLADAHNI